MPTTTRTSAQHADAGLQGPDDDWHTRPRGDAQAPGEGRSAFARMPVTTTAGRACAVIFGLLAGAAMIFVDGLVAAISSCTGPGDLDAPSALCRSVGGWLDGAEIVLVLIGGLGLLAGGILSAVKRDARWIAGATLFGVLVTILVFGLAGEQTSQMQ